MTPKMPVLYQESVATPAAAVTRVTSPKDVGLFLQRLPDGRYVDVRYQYSRGSWVRMMSGHYKGEWVS